MHTSSTLIDNQDRKRVLLAANYFIAVMSAFTSYINFKVGTYLALASIQAVVVFICFYLILKIRSDKLRLSYSLITSSIYMLLVTYATYMSNLNTAIGAWGMTLPVLFYFLNSIRPGFIFSIMYLFIYTWILVGVYNTQSIKPLANFVLAYLIVWGIAHVYEKNRLKNQAQLTVLALKDPLTNANNLLALRHDFEQRTKAEKGVGLAMLDIDFFKKVNDTYGHDVGDDILMQLVELFQQKVSEKDVYRTGGEEFVLLFDASEDEVLKVLKEICTETEHKIFNCSNGNNINVTLSCGFIHFSAIALQEPNSLSKMLKTADQLLYHAKEQGRNQIITREN
ncbi:GGDEF domain-containing protein [Pseudoalteromonas shioyasakiensis]|uniref:GGDEF domain-containing protein n=1 Tax=Pseudoalteromonas shioyasakiensis TaxID=1190813 RepID=UPI0021197729|nr:GGDEF domain-containing protein [Pseudoalteromonas shioyasakiensis]MCQ8878682.1 GGDEF domain-containing protein [Pseudoalteromonas shioyasakiensis]